MRYALNMKRLDHFHSVAGIILYFATIYDEIISPAPRSFIWIRPKPHNDDDDQRNSNGIGAKEQKKTGQSRLQALDSLLYDILFKVI